MCGPFRSVVPILLVEDSLDDAELISIALRRAGLAFSLTCVDTEPDFRRALDEGPRVILCDFHLPRFSCERVLAMAAECSPPPPVIVVSRHIDEDDASAARQLGAAAVVSKRRLPDLATQITACLSRPVEPGPGADRSAG